VTRREIEATRRLLPGVTQRSAYNGHQISPASDTRAAAVLHEAGSNC
jgi:hypothetical protein